MPAREWVAVYYDNPEEVPAEKLRCVTAVTVDEDYVIPANSEGVIPRRLPAGITPAPARGWWITTSPLRGCSFRQPAAEHGVSHRPQPCFEVYLNDGNHDGYWDIDMYVPVERVAS